MESTEIQMINDVEKVFAPAKEHTSENRLYKLKPLIIRWNPGSYWLVKAAISGLFVVIYLWLTFLGFVPGVSDTSQEDMPERTLAEMQLVPSFNAPATVSEPVVVRVGNH